MSGVFFYTISTCFYSLHWIFVNLGESNRSTNSWQQKLGFISSSSPLSITLGLLVCSLPLPPSIQSATQPPGRVGQCWKGLAEQQHDQYGHTNTHTRSLLQIETSLCVLCGLLSTDPLCGHHLHVCVRLLWVPGHVFCTSTEKQSASCGSLTVISWCQ